MDRLNDHQVPQVINSMKTNAENELQIFHVVFPQPRGICYGDYEHTVVQN